MVVTVPPATATPWKTIAYSGRLGAIRPTVSPGLKPRAARPPANWWTRWRSSAKVYVRPVGPSSRATRGGGRLGGHGRLAGDHPPRVVSAKDELVGLPRVGVVPAEIDMHRCVARVRGHELDLANFDVVLLPEADVVVERARPPALELRSQLRPRRLVIARFDCRVVITKVPVGLCGRERRWYRRYAGRRRRGHW